MIAPRFHAPELLRKTLQWGVLLFIVANAFGGLWRNYKMAHGQQRLVALMEGPVWGALYGVYEHALSLFGDSYEVAGTLLGFPWTSRVFGLETVDPLLVTSLLSQGVIARAGLLFGLAIPIGVALVLGKVFCSHLCPARLVFEWGEPIRRGLIRLGVPLPEMRPSERFGGWVLLGGLVASALTSTAVWILILPYAALGAGIHLWIMTGTVGGLLGIVVSWLAVDVLAAPGFFCQSLCPTGFLLEQLGRRSALGVGKRAAATPCPPSCSACQLACPYSLLPKDGSHRPACDSCARCVTACPGDRLERRVDWPRARFTSSMALVAASLAIGFAPPASAHHNKGMPHYGYFENYAQVPSEEFLAIDQRWEMGATLFNFQGLDRRNADTPNDVKIYIYLFDLEAGRGWEGPADFEIVDGDQSIARFSRQHVDEESVYSTRETIPHAGEYRLIVRVDGDRLELPFYVELATDGIRYELVLALLIPTLALFAVARRGRQKRRKHRRKTRATGAILAIAISALLGVSPSEAQPAPETAPEHACSAQMDSPHGHARSARTDSAHEHGGSAQAHATSEHASHESGANAHHEMRMGHDGEAHMVMSGLPLRWMLTAVTGIIVLSFVASDRWAPAPNTGRRRARRANLIRYPRIYRALRSRWLQVIPQWATLGAFAFVVFAGLYGSPGAGFVTTLVWTIWWGGLVFTVLFLGSAWCFACPWDGLANLLSRVRLGLGAESISLGLPFPRALANVYPAIALFALLTWLELARGVTTDSRWTAYMGIGMAAAAVASALSWDGKRFCAHFCPVGRICGVYSNVSPVEIRARNPRTCDVCTTEECLHGNERGLPCPTGISLKTTSDATMCTACTECIKSCDKHNVALNLRPFGADLVQPSAPRLDVAWLCIVLLALTLFHGLSMTVIWENFEPGRMSVLKTLARTLGTPRLVNYSAAMIAAVAIPVVLYYASCLAGARLAARSVTPLELFERYALSLLPIAFCYHLAHNFMHLVRESPHLLPQLQDPFGTAAFDVAGGAMSAAPLLSESALWVVQLALIVSGHVLGVVTAHRTGIELFPDRSTARKSLVPLLMVMVAVSVTGLWLTHLDMNMRVGRM